MAERTLSQQVKTRLRRIEGQVRGIQGMLDRMEEGPASRERLEQQVRDMLAAGERPARVARALGITRRRVSDIACGRCGPEGEPCDSLLTQILAVRAAVEQAGLMIMELHLQQCVFQDVPIDEGKLEDLRESFKLWSRLRSG